MKSTANCDKHCELQNSANQQTLERSLHFRVIPGSLPASVSSHSSSRAFLRVVRGRGSCALGVLAAGGEPQVHSKMWLVRWVPPISECLEAYIFSGQPAE